MEKEDTKCQRRVVVATSSDPSKWKNNLDPEMDAIASYLASRQVLLETAPWEDDDVAWEIFDMVIIIRAFSYTEKWEQFMTWIEMLRGKSVKVENSPALVKWNIDKSYMVDLAKHGIPTIETILVDSSGFNLDKVSMIAKTHNWHTNVIKPSVGSCSNLCYKLQMDPLSQQVISEEEIRMRDYVTAAPYVLVQPYIPSITTVGEWSVIMIGGVYSHTVIAHPPEGDFRLWCAPPRVAPESAPTRQMINMANRVIDILPEIPLYARVDMLYDDCTGSFVISEVELLEPYLSLLTHSASIEMFAQEVLHRLFE